MQSPGKKGGTAGAGDDTLPSAPKSSLRRHAIRTRKEACRQQRPQAARRAAQNLLDAVPLPDGCIVALYQPAGSELDTRPLAHMLARRDVTMALPVITAKDRPLVFRRYTPGAPLTDGPCGTRIPEQDAGVVTPSVIVTPLLAFTDTGDRLGYGGGYYDRTLSALRTEADILAAGYAFAAQKVDRLPVTDTDERLDLVVTESFSISFQSLKRGR